MNSRQPAHSAPAALPPIASLPRWLRRDLRSDHAGETGAVYLYLGILSISKDAEVRAFATEHLAQEQQHLAFFEAWMSPRDTSLLIPLWRLAGWILGVLSALMGRNAVFVTVDAVEEFVVGHYNEQLLRLHGNDHYGPIALVLEQFCHDEQHHREDAIARCATTSDGFAAALWRQTVGKGSAVAVMVARAF
ncbi:MAG: demethoxyubiquinone hydroxylase family protein [Pseudomonadota bacterium]